MDTEDTGTARPSLPPKPKVPPKPQRWRRATDVILRKETGEEVHRCRAERKTKHQSLPVINRSPTAVQDPDQPSHLVALDTPVGIKPIPKPRLHRTPRPQDSQPQPVDDRTVLGYATLSSTNSTFLVEGSSESSQALPACVPSCPSVCHHAIPPGAGQMLLGKNGPPEKPDQCTQTGREDCEAHLDYWHIVPQSRLEQPSRVPPRVPVPSRPLPKEPERISLFTDETELHVCEGVYMEVDISPNSGEGSKTLTLDHKKTESDHTTSPVGGIGSHCTPTKQLPSGNIHKNNEMAAHLHSEHQDVVSNCDTVLDGLVTDLHKKFLIASWKKRDTDTEKPKAKRNSGHKALGKVSPTNDSIQSSTQKRKTTLADMMLFSFQSKPYARTEQDKKTSPTISQESLTVGSSDEESTGGELQQTLQNTHGNVSVLPLTSPSQSMQACQGQTDEVLSPSDQEARRPGSPLQEDSGGKTNRGQHITLENLWQERTIVRESGILSQLSKQQLLLQENMYEVVTTEHSYLESLGVAVDHFLESPALNQALAPRDRKSLFSGIAKIREISQNFLHAMKDELDSTLFCDTCEVIGRFASGPFSAYVDYIRNMPYQEQTLHNLGKESPQIVNILRKLQEDSRCNRLPLKSFLVLPFQRITRLKILVENILKRTDSESETHSSAERALREISKVVEACNREVGQMKQMEEMVHIANKTEFECKALPLVSSSRRLVRQGELAHLSEKENIFGQKKLCPVYLFLFNDLLLVATRKGLDRFVVRDHVHRSLIEVNEGVEVDEDLDGCELDRTFRLALLKNHRGTTSQYLLQAPSQTEKASWMEVLSQRKGEEEQIYEEWDCPQVQCTEAYHGQQPGELSLQTGDIINVIQKTTDGFLEGRRLLHGERGWFPALCIVEIPNEHVQRRHLRQRYHVLQAATRMLNRRLSNEQRATTCFR